MTKRDSARSASAATQRAAEDKIVIAVDFGTTFSGVATVYSATPDEVDIIRTWPGTARLYHASFAELLMLLQRWQWNH
jgi:threonine dehydratase